MAKIDQRRKAADEAELIWREGGMKESEREESEVDRKRKGWLSLGGCNQHVSETLLSLVDCPA